MEVIRLDSDLVFSQSWSQNKATASAAFDGPSAVIGGAAEVYEGDAAACEQSAEA